MSDFWDARYGAARASEETVWSRDPNVWIAGTIGPLEPGTVVDLGAGEGRNSLWLASLGWRVTAVDFSSIGLDTGRDRAKTLGLTIDWVHADATTWLPPEPVDLVVIAYLQLPLEPMRRAIGNAAASLAPGGSLVLVGHDRDNIEHGVGGPQDPELLLTVDEVTDAAAGLTIDEARQYRRPTHAGTAIDTILVARKPL
jgi:SAM-dependent methyltransferase